MSTVSKTFVLFSFAGVLLAGVASAQPEHRWLDVDGNPLPFQTDDALLEFMRTADVIDEKDIGTGVNRSVRVTLEQNSVRAHAIFREVDRRERGVTIGRAHYQFFADSYLFECAAYELAKKIGLDRVPPTVLRKIERRSGSLQIWLEDALDEDHDTFAPPSPLDWAQRVWDMHLFDNLVYNIDRNPGNMLVDEDYRLWMIDHTRGFQAKRGLLNDRVVRVRRAVWDRLTALTDDELKDTVRDYLTFTELGSLVERRKALQAYVDELVLERGEDAVFY